MGHRRCSRSGSSEVFGLQPPIDDWLKEEAVEPGDASSSGSRRWPTRRSRRRSTELPPETWIQIEKSILLQSLDHHWKEHLAMLDALRQVVHLRAYAQKKPIDEYKHEAFALFERMLGAIREDVTRTLAPRQFTMQPPRTCRAAGAARLHHPPYRSVHRRRRHRRHRRRHRRDPVAAAAAADRRGRRCRRDVRGRRGRHAPGQPQRALPVRLGPQVQALPRRSWRKKRAGGEGNPPALLVIPAKAGTSA